jgi:hypothetical protein
MKTGFSKQVRELRIQRKNPGNALQTRENQQQGSPVRVHDGGQGHPCQQVLLFGGIVFPPTVGSIHPSDGSYLHLSRKQFFCLKEIHINIYPPFFIGSLCLGLSVQASKTTQSLFLLA